MSSAEKFRLHGLSHALNLRHRCLECARLPPNPSGAFIVNRRDLLVGFASIGAGGFVPSAGFATAPQPVAKDFTPPYDTRSDFVTWMQAHRGEDPNFLGQRWDRL